MVLLEGGQYKRPLPLSASRAAPVSCINPGGRSEQLRLLLSLPSQFMSDGFPRSVVTHLQSGLCAARRHFHDRDRLLLFLRHHHQQQAAPALQSGGRSCSSAACCLSTDTAGESYHFIYSLKGYSAVDIGAAGHVLGQEQLKEYETVGCSEIVLAFILADF